VTTYLQIAAGELDMVTADVERLLGRPRHHWRTTWHSIPRTWCGPSDATRASHRYAGAERVNPPRAGISPDVLQDTSAPRSKTCEANFTPAATSSATFQCAEGFRQRSRVTAG
jgi:hypothetical protein